MTSSPDGCAYCRLVGKTGQACWRVNRDLEFSEITSGVEALLGYTPQEAKAMPLRSLLSAASFSLFMEAASERFLLDALGEPNDHLTTLELQQRRKDETSVWTTVSFLPARDSLGRLEGFVGVTRDIEPRKRLAREATEAGAAVSIPSEVRRSPTDPGRVQETFCASGQGVRAALEQASDWEIWRGPGGETLCVSPSCQRVSGYAAEDFLNDAGLFGRIVHAEDVEAWRLFMAGEGHTGSDGLDARIFRKDGRVRWVWLMRHEIIGPNKDVLGERFTIRDITKRKSVELHLKHQALHDSLTGLANRVLCLDRITRAMERAKHREGYHYAVVFLDLDHFKLVNHSLGHGAGDKILAETGRRLMAKARPLDTVARFDGDDFVLLLDGLAMPREAMNIAKQVREAFTAPFEIDGQEIRLTVSLGVALGSPAFATPDDALLSANIAMHRSKEAGRDTIKAFNPRMIDKAVQRLSMENDMRRGLKRKEFFLHYQPIYLLEGQKLIGFEALARWNHPEKGLLQPVDFIPLAEETGCILELGQWVLAKSCATMADWRKKTPKAADLILSVNISAKQFADPGFEDVVRRALETTKTPGRTLKLEITETAIMDTGAFAVEKLNRLKELGVCLSVDDFGKGYSSMSYLQHFPLDHLKIDLSFVQRMHEVPENLKVIKATIKLAHSLGLSVVAEGIELVEHKDVLTALDCEFGQGFLFSRPIDGNEAESLIDREDKDGLAPGTRTGVCALVPPLQEE